MHSTLLEAEIDEDVILSYRWMAERGIQISPRKHGFWVEASGQELWVEGLRSDPRQRANARLQKMPVFINRVPVEVVTPAKPRALDMFCGRKSAARILQEHGYEVLTLDNDPKRQPDICIDVLKWDFRSQFPPDHFQLIVACPPCTEYSAAMTRRARQMDKADEVVRRTLEIIEYFKPETWWLETQRNGRLPKRKVVEGLPFVDIDYCRFEDCGYQKPTRFFGSAHVLELDAVLCDGRACPGLVRHKPWKPGVAYHHRWHKGGGAGRVHRETAYHIPQGVIEYVSGLSPKPPSWPPVEPDEVETPEAKVLRVTLGDPEFLQALEEVRTWRVAV
jgi:hypothetical protein